MSKKNNIFFNKLLLFLGVMPFLCVSCMQSTTFSTSTSSVAKLSSMSFNAQDSFPGLAAARFVVDERLDTGLVYNEDSLLYGTRINKVVPSFVYEATPGSVIMHLSDPDTTFYLAGQDTIDFTRQPIYMTIKSMDGTTTKVYELRVIVHQADPDLFTWTCLNSQIYTPDPDGAEQKAFLLNDELCLMVNNGFQNRLYTSYDGEQWNGPITPIGLPNNCIIRSIVSDGSKAYYADADKLYVATSADEWTMVEQTEDLTPLTMLMTFNDSVWAVVKDDLGVLYLATVGENDQLHLSGYNQPLDPDFPISHAAITEFESVSERVRATIIGGFSRSGKSLNSRWNIEYSTSSGYRLVNFSTEKPIFQSITGATVVFYNDALFMFGGVDDNLQYQQPIRYSLDEGMRWNVPDSAHNVLPASFGLRQKQSAFVYDNNIYLIGGSYLNKTYSDIYRGRIASIDWIKRD